MLKLVWHCDGCEHDEENVPADAEPGLCSICRTKMRRVQAFSQEEFVTSVQKAAHKCVAYAAKFLDEFPDGDEALCASGLMYLGLCKQSNVNALQFARFLLDMHAACVASEIIGAARAPS